MFLCEFSKTYLVAHVSNFELIRIMKVFAHFNKMKIKQDLFQNIRMSLRDGYQHFVCLCLIQISNIICLVYTHIIFEMWSFAATFAFSHNFIVSNDCDNGFHIRNRNESCAFRAI